MPICFVVASGRPAVTDVEAVPRRHILEPRLPTMGMPQVSRALEVSDSMNARVRGALRGPRTGESGRATAGRSVEGLWMRYTGSSGPVGKGDAAFIRARSVGTHMAQPGSSG